MTRAEEAQEDATEVRRRRLLEAAFLTFARYGYRKTSMEEVARAAHLSRQGLYLHFSTKEELFRGVVRHVLESGLAEARGQLQDDTQPVEARLLGAFDAWVGRFVGMFGAEVTDIEEASTSLLGATVSEHEEQFLEGVSRLLRASGVVAAYRPAGLQARQLAETLLFAARGMKHGVASRTEFNERMAVAVKALCLPLRERS
ncbi:MAG: TetR/AcrR family transcriptional regulator [Polyangiaceae bacterium]|jgi:AcrR family transcriptional regulator|nr:TetR/AcrR family transcriptional regulator [Polyangiaceae bacterium]